MVGWRGEGMGGEVYLEIEMEPRKLSKFPFHVAHVFDSNFATKVYRLLVICIPFLDE